MQGDHRVLLALIVVSLLCAPCLALLPGIRPRTYSQGEEIKLLVNKMTSPRTQLPYSYYSLPFCQPSKINDTRENLGEMLMGDRLENSLYEASIYESERCSGEDCRYLCTVELDPKEPKFAKGLRKLRERIREEYRIHWLLDGLPAATVKIFSDSKGKQRSLYEDGFPLGVKEGNDVFINNHVTLKIMYHDGVDLITQKSGIQVVAFEVYPESIRHERGGGESKPTCSNRGQKQIIDPKAKNTIVFTYSVVFEQSETPWKSRWDLYLQMIDKQIHWFSIVNSFMIVLFLTGMVAMIMIRTLRADLRKYNMPLEQEDIQEETGWKLVHGDVFRPPKNRMLLSVLCGTGVQIFSMFLILFLFAVVGVLSPQNRGSMLTAMPVLFVLMGVFAGYFSASTYKLMGGQQWKRNTLLTAFLLPGIVFAVVVFLNFFLLGEHSSGAAGPGTVFSLIGLWFGISVPLVFLGSFFGYKRPAPENPLRTNLIPRLIPEQIWYMKPIFSILMGGILPFGVVFIELFFILSSIWLQQFYYLWTFLVLVFFILVITCAEISIVMCYFQLCSEDYHWWWRAFLTSGASAWYMFGYSIFYYHTRLNIIGFVSTLLYFGYSFIMSLAFFVLTGSVGFYSCLWFVRYIYASVHLS